MASLLIKDTTREERERIVADAIDSMADPCEGCMGGLEDMYQDYIDGKMEISEINMRFRAKYISAEVDKPSPRRSCEYFA